MHPREGADGHLRLSESHHDFPVDERVQGRVVDVQVVLLDGGVARPVLRVPNGRALRGVDDDGHLEDPWTGEVITSRGQEFLVTVRTRSRAGRSDPGAASSREPVHGA